MLDFASRTEKECKLMGWRHATLFSLFNFAIVHGDRDRCRGVYFPSLVACEVIYTC
jgi:hypothetical protein